MIDFALVSLGIADIVGIVLVTVSQCKKMKRCEHRNTATYVDVPVATCERVTVTCLDCRKVLSSEIEC